MMRKFILFSIGLLFSLAAISAEPIAIVCDDVRTNYYAQDNDWYIELFSTNAWKVVFDIVANPLVDKQEYTLADMIASECYIQRSTPYAKMAMTAAGYTQYVDGAGLLHISALVTADGQQYLITYGEEACEVNPSKQVYDIDFAATTMQDNTAMAGDNASVQFIGENPDGTRLMVCFKTHAIAGTYTWDNAYEVLCHFTTVEDGQSVNRDFCSLSAVITPTEPKEDAEEGGYLCEVEGVTTDGESVRARMEYIPSVCAIPTMKDFVATNLKVTEAIDQYERVIVRAHTRELDLNLWLETDHIEDVFTTEALDTVYSTLRDNGVGEQAMITSCYVTIEPDTLDASQYVVHGWVLTDACVRYILDLSYVKQEMTREETLLIEEADLTDATLSNGWFQLKGYTEDYLRYVILTLRADSLAGEYTLDDVEYEFSYVVDVDESDILLPNDYYDLVDFAAKVTVVERELTLEAEMLTHGVIQEEDVPLFHVTMTATLPKGLKYDAEEDVVAYLPTVYVNNAYFESEGASSVFAMDLEEYEEAFLLLYVTDTVGGIPAGTYTISDSRLTGTVLACQGAIGDEIQASFYGLTDMDGILQTPAWMLREGTVEVYYVEGALGIQVEALNSCGNTISLTLGAQNPMAVEQTENDAPLRKYIDGARLLIRRYDDTYNIMGIRL